MGTDDYSFAKSALSYLHIGCFLCRTNILLEISVLAQDWPMSIAHVPVLATVQIVKPAFEFIMQRRYC